MNNGLFLRPKMQNMKPSMALLHKLAQARDVRSPAALARMLGVSQQRLKNWEARGISKEGALKAQAMLGFDCNKLLALDVDDTATPQAAKPRRPLLASVSAGPHVAQEPVRTLVTPAWPWPFQTVTHPQWRQLTTAQQQTVESVVLALLTHQGDTGPPTKQQPPAPSGAAA